MPGPIVVLTGASSGIGRASAHELAAAGASLMLAARDRVALEVVATECGRLGGTCELVPLDVSDAAAVGALAEKAIDRFGHFDVWVNNVGVGAVGRFEETPIEAHRRVIESNLLGHINGSHAALTHFRQRHRGILINMVSLGGWLASPYAAAYTSSKFGLRGLGQCLRAELADEPDIHVCDVYPAFVDTPGVTQHGANYTGHRLKPIRPLLSPKTVAKRIVSLIDEPRPILVIGSMAHVGRYTQVVASEIRGRTMKRIFDRALSRAPAAPLTDGNLFEVSHTHAISGGRTQRLGDPAWWALGVVGAAGLALYALTRGSTR
jgi:short-subunit dehydrogenase